MKLKDWKIEIKADDGGLGEFTAYASTFTREPDAYGDVIAKGAFTKTLADWADSGNTLPIYYGHRLDDPDYNIGAIIEAAEDDHGLKVVGKLDLEKAKAAQVYDLLRAKRLSQLSFGFNVLDEETVTLDDGRKANELREIKLYEVSLVPVGANEDTEVLAVKEAARKVASKAGRVISAKTEKELVDAVADMGVALGAVQSATKKIQAVLEPLNDSEEAAPASAPAKAAQPARAKLNLLEAQLNISKLTH